MWAEGGGDDEDSERSNGKSAADENQIASLARPLFVGSGLSLRRAPQYYQPLVGDAANARQRVSR